MVSITIVADQDLNIRLATAPDTDLEARVSRLETQVANEAADLAQMKADVDKHNADDAQFQENVNQRVADLEAAVAANDTTAIDQAIVDLKASIAAQPTLTLPA